MRSTSGVAADQRVDLAGLRLLVEVDAIGGQRVLAAAARLLLALVLRRLRRAAGRAITAAGARALGGAAGRLGDAVADEVDRVQPRHVLHLQEIHGVALALAEQRHQHVGAGDLVAAGALHVYGGALHHTLEAGGGLGLRGAVRGQAGEVLVEELGQVLAELVEIDAAGAQHGGRIAVIGQAEQQVLKGGVFVTAVAGEGEGPVQCLLEISG